MSVEKRSEGVCMREAVAVVAGPREFGDNRKSWLARAARRANISYRAAKQLFYGEITDPEHKAARRMVEAARQHGAIEAQGLADVFERTAAAMRLTDPDFYGADVAALVDAARALRGLDRSRDDPARTVAKTEK